MSEIDWSKAPEGATHYGAEDSIYVECWYKQCKDGWLFAAANSDWQWSERKTSISPGRLRDLIPRLPQAWSGEGLPPAGVACQWFSPIYGWLGGKVVGHDGTLTIIAHNDGYTGCHPHEVRPIRTPEQIAADEREAAIRAIVYDLQDAENLSSLPSIANCLYGKGYRKP